jgi:hypothetical protein
MLAMSHRDLAYFLANGAPMWNLVKTAIKHEDRYPTPQGKYLTGVEYFTYIYSVRGREWARLLLDRVL